jgi:transposase-like protein
LFDAGLDTFVLRSSVFSDFAPYARRSKSLKVLIPILYLKGISTGVFEEALAALLGKDAGSLSAATVSRLKEAWSNGDRLLLGSLRWPNREVPNAQNRSGRGD